MNEATPVTDTTVTSPVVETSTTVATDLANVTTPDTSTAPPAATPKAAKAKAAKVAKPAKPAKTGPTLGAGITIMGDKAANFVPLAEILPGQFYTYAETANRVPLASDGVKTVSIVREKSAVANPSKWASAAKVFRVRPLTASEMAEGSKYAGATFKTVHTHVAVKAAETPATPDASAEAPAASAPAETPASTDAPQGAQA